YGIERRNRMLELKPAPGSVPIALPPQTEHALAAAKLSNTAAEIANARRAHRLITDFHASTNTSPALV
ncbi:MAG: hypothetical protein ACE5G0_22390, partial [Rhodothermales bacterium]